MTQSPLQIMDALLDPILVAANKIRQVRDALPTPLWFAVPEAFRVPLQALFDASEKYDQAIGRMKMAGLVSGVGTNDQS